MATKTTKTIIIGAGISGLACAKNLADQGFEVDVYDKDSVMGGLSATIIDGDYCYDRGPHYFFTTLSEKVGILDKSVRVPYYESICYNTKYYSFPFGLLKNLKFFISVFCAYGFNSLFRKKNADNLYSLLKNNYGKVFTNNILQPLIEKWAGVEANQISIDFGKRLLPGNLKYIFYSLIKKIRGYTEDYYQSGRYMVYPLGGMKTVFDKLTEKNNFTVHLN